MAHMFDQSFAAGRLRGWCIAALLVWGAASIRLVEAKPDAAPAAPDVLVIDDFEQGLDQWQSQGAGRIELSDDTEAGGHSLMWTSDDDGIGRIVFQNLDPARIDFSRYDLLVFRIKVAGKPIWNINPIIQQAPHGYGYRTLYYSIDTMDPQEQWYTFCQDLSRWENAWPDTYDTTKQEFQFEIQQLAAGANQEATTPARTRIYLDDIRLMRNPLGLQPSYPGQWEVLADGSQTTRFAVTMTNRGQSTLTVKAALTSASSIQRFQVVLPEQPLVLAPGATGSFPVQISASASVVKDVRLGYGETAQLAVTANEVPGLVLFTDLVAGIGAAQPVHPAVVCDPARMTELQQQWGDPAARKALPRYFSDLAKQAEKALEYVPAYPPLAAMGIKQDAITGGKLQQIDVPNLPFNVYQDPISGRTYSGHMYDAGVLNWAADHLANAANARKLGLGYLLTGRQDFAVAAAAILNRYADCYLDLPIVAPAQASVAGSATSGACRIGSSYMSERVWLSNLAVALDAIRPAGVLTAQQVERIGARVFEPSANLMMDHKVGVMNLQWMINGAALQAGVAADLPAVVARALHDRHGIVRLVELGFLPDGQWWENPSYQGVAKLVAYPALGIALHNGMMPWDSRYETILLAAHQLHGPDGRSPTLGTGGWRTLSTESTGAHIFARFITDPRLAWVLHHQPSRREPYDMEDFAQFRQTEPRVPEVQTIDPRPTGTTNFPDYGGVALRLPGTDHYCYFHYGRDLTHGHRNKLSINAYGAGGWYTRNVMGGYGDNFQNFLETIASSTSIVVDGQNADTDTGELLYLKSMPGAEIASARENGAWKDVEHERTVVLTAGPLIVIDRCQAQAEHTYDWLYHANQTNLELQSPQPTAVAPDVLGPSIHYAGLTPLGQLAADHAINWTRTRKGAGGLLLRLLPQGEVIAFSTKDASGGDTGLLWRQRGQTVGFAAAYLPYAKDAPATVDIKPIALKTRTGQPVTLDDAQAYDITWPQGRARVLVRYRLVELQGFAVPAEQRVWVELAN